MSSAYRSLHINTSRQIMEYKSFPMSDEYPTYPNHVQIAHYFDTFVDHFGFRDRIQFRTEVTRVAPADGGWDVTVRRRGADADRDAPLRRGARRQRPSLGRAAARTGVPRRRHVHRHAVHSHDYKNFEGFEGKRVLVLGIGNSACDIAVETSKVSDRTFLAMRRGAHVVPKYLFGIPTDHLTTSPLAQSPFLWTRRLGLAVLLRLSRGKITKYGLPKPDHKVLSAHPTISDDILTRLGHGDIVVKPNIERLDGDKVYFTDGTAEQIDIDRLLHRLQDHVPVPRHHAVRAVDNEISLFHRVVDPDHPGLYFIGLVQPLGAIMPLAEAQSEWVADLLDGDGDAAVRATRCAARSRATTARWPSATSRRSGTRSRSTSSSTWPSSRRRAAPRADPGRGRIAGCAQVSDPPAQQSAKDAE